MRGASRWLSIAWCIATGVGTAHAATLTAYTEEWPPYNYLEGGLVKGISTDILRAVCREEKLTCDFKIMPWARAYKIVTSTPNTLLYTTARKPSRESEFHWVGPLLPRSTWVFGRAGQEKVTQTTADLTKLRIGVVRDEAALQDLQDLGVPLTSLVVQTSNAEVLKVLSTGTIDAMVDTEIGMAWNMRKASMAPKAVSKLMKLSEGGAYYFAFNLESDPQLVRKVQAALDKIRRHGGVATVVERYTSGKLDFSDTR